MLPETDRSNLAYDLSMYDNAARREQEREQERERERRARQIKMNMHSLFICPLFLVRLFFLFSQHHLFIVRRTESGMLLK